LQLELVTGIRVLFDTDTKTLIWVLLQTLINNGTLKSKKRFVAKHKTEIFVAGATLQQFVKSSASLQLLLQPAHIIQVQQIIYLKTQHYSSLQLLIRPNLATHKMPKLTDLSFIQSLVGMRLYIN
jgi:hypothetical protein